MADPVYLSITELPGTGTAAPTVVDFNFAGGYINRTHIKAYILDTTTFARTDVPVLAEHFVTDWRLQLPVSVPVGSVLRVYRDTPKDVPLVDFTNGARINEGNLDLVAQQATFVAAEAIDQLEGSGVEEGLAAASVAAGSADAAAASEAAAAASAAAALSSQNSAAASASAASTSAGAAAASQSAAAASAGAASASQSAAASSATAAAASQTAAAGSASSAASSSSTATSAASTATSQASAAASSASAASGSASAAAASQSAAAASAAAAAASAASVDAANLVHKTGNETIGGSKTFSSTIVGSVTGNAATVTNGVYTTGDQTINGAKTFTGALTLAADRLNQTGQGIGFEMGPGVASGVPTKQGLYVPAGKSLYLAGNANGAVIELGPSGVTFPAGLTLPTSSVNAATAGSAVGGIGTYAILFSASNVAYDSNYAGSSLRAQGIGRAADNVLSTPNGTGNLQTGTWKCLGSFSSSNGGVALFLRIA